MTKQLLATSLLLLCITNSALAGEDKTALKAQSKAWAEAFNAGDAAALAALYTTDAMLLPPNAEPVEGRKAIAAFWGELIAGVGGELEIKEALVQGDLAYTIGMYTLVDDAGEIVDRGKYIEIWKRADGVWALHRDIWNTSVPEADMAAE